MPEEKPKKETNQGLPLTSTQTNNMMITDVGYDASTNPSATSDFTRAGAISTASGGNTNYAAGLGLMADTSGLKAEKSFTNPTSSRKEARQEKRATRLENRMAVQTAKGKAAAGDGRFIDANNKQGRVQNLQKRIDRLRK